MAASEFPNVPSYTPDHPSLLKKIILTVQNLVAGRSNNASSTTLTAGSATTVVTLPEGMLGQNTQIFFAPQTVNAATEFGAGLMYVSSRDVLLNTFTITHTNNAQTDRTFGFILVG